MCLHCRIAIAILFRNNIFPRRIGYIDSSDDEDSQSDSSPAKSVRESSKSISSDSTVNTAKSEVKKNVLKCTETSQSNLQYMNFKIRNKNINEKFQSKKPESSSNPEIVAAMFSCKIEDRKKSSKYHSLANDKKEKEKKKDEKSKKSNLMDSQKRDPNVKTDSTLHSKLSKVSTSESYEKDKKKVDVKPKDKITETRPVSSKSMNPISDKNHESVSRRDSTDSVSKKISESKSQRASSSSKSEKSSTKGHHSFDKKLVSKLRQDTNTELVKKAISSTSKSETLAKTNYGEKTLEKQVSIVPKIAKPKKMSFEDEILKADSVQIKKPKSSSSSKSRVSEKVASKSTQSSSFGVTPTTTSNKLLALQTKEKKISEETHEHSLNSTVALKDSLKATHVQLGKTRPEDSHPHNIESHVIQLNRDDIDTMKSNATLTNESDLSLDKSEGAEVSVAQVPEVVRYEASPTEDEALIHVKFELMSESSHSSNEGATQPGKTLHLIFKLLISKW
jgi:hypothetical protein